MKVLITGICGYVGARLAQYLCAATNHIDIYGIDNLARRGSETNIPVLKRLGVYFIHGDIRNSSDTRALPSVDWVIDCAAIPTVMAGLSGSGGSGTNSEQLLEHNLLGTINILEYCRQHKAGFLLLSTSRVYSIDELMRIPLREMDTRFEPVLPSIIHGFTEQGISERFSVQPPVSLYGASKLASEILSLEYGGAFGFPVWINRCSVIGGTGQFGKIDQGILSFWCYSFALATPLKYIGFGGRGKQVRDFVTADDVSRLILQQINDPTRDAPRIVNVGGGRNGSLSLREMSEICSHYFGQPFTIDSDTNNRPFDVPYYVTDTTLVTHHWNWKPENEGGTILAQLCEWALANMDFINALNLH